MQVNYFPKVAIGTLDTQREPFAVPVKWVNEKLEKKSETVVAECKEVAACRIIQVPPAPTRRPPSHLVRWLSRSRGRWQRRFWTGTTPEWSRCRPAKLPHE
jgi:hypothetical protein